MEIFFATIVLKVELLSLLMIVLLFSEFVIDAWYVSLLPFAHVFSAVALYPMFGAVELYEISMYTNISFCL